jgi:hypothetical protein
MKISLVQYGRLLTDRQFGKTVMEQLRPRLSFPVELDFSGVLSLGSSFGDEVIAPIAKMQDSSINVFNANIPVKACLNQIAENHKIKVNINSAP